MTESKFVPSDALRRRVAIAAGAGMAHEEIALGLGVSRDELEQHFAHELTVGAYQKRMEALEGLHKAAKKGNAAAAKLYAQMAPQVAAPPATEPKAEKLGKKEQAQRDAVGAQVGTEWNDILPGSKALQ